MPQTALSSAWVLASALTHIHVGVGQAPGVVDLPVLRDSMGYFYIPGSSLKGSIKSTLSRLGTENVKDYLGGEPGENDAEPGTLAFLDLYPLLVPLPSIDRGVIFATTPLLLTRATMLASILEDDSSGNNGRLENVKLKRLLSYLKEMKDIVIKEFNNNNSLRMMLLTWGEPTDKDGALCISTSCQKIQKVTKINKEEDVPGKLSEINEAYQVLLRPDRFSEILVLSDKVAPRIFDRSLIRQARIRLEKETKTVKSGGLWTEEYIPHFTLFSGAIVDTGLKSSTNQGSGQNPIDWIVDAIENRLGGTIIVGGKETIGKGILKIGVVKL